MAASPHPVTGMTTDTERTDLDAYRERLDPDGEALLDELLYDLQSRHDPDDEDEALMAAVIELKRELEDLRNQLEIERIRDQRGQQLGLAEAMH